MDDATLHQLIYLIGCKTNMPLFSRGGLVSLFFLATYFYLPLSQHTSVRYQQSKSRMISSDFQQDKLETSTWRLIRAIRPFGPISEFPQRFTVVPVIGKVPSLMVCFEVDPSAHTPAN